MKATVQKLQIARRQVSRDFSCPCTGHIVEILQSGEVTVDFVGNTHGPIVARSTIQGRNEAVVGEFGPGVSVLLVFEDGDPTRPVLVGPINERLFAPDVLQLPLKRSEHSEFAVLDGKRIRLEAKEEIVLQCGKGSITLTADGRIVIKGNEIVSRASRAHKIKGATVNIN